MRHLLVTALLVIASSAAAQEYPTFGNTGHRTEKDFITFQCNKSGNAEITCDFAQIKIKSKGSPDKLVKALAQIPEMLKDAREGTSSTMKQCGEYRDYATFARTGVRPKGMSDETYAFAKQRQSEMHEREHADLLKILEALQRFCESPSEKTAEAFLRAGADKEARTCNVYVNKFTQSFRPSGPNWVHSAAPTGECGVVYVSTLSPTDDKRLFWNYTTRKVVTNKAAGNSLLQCKDLDEAEYAYEWNVTEYYKGCDYIKYGFF